MKNLHPLYHSDDYNRDPFMYVLFRKALEEIIDFKQIDSFADVGCINGRLMESLKKKYPHLSIHGWDIFEWARQYADQSIREQIELFDLRKPLEKYAKYSMVVCTEVGEHIDKEYEDVFLDNLQKISEDVLVLSWSNEKNPQHFNPRPRSYIAKQMHKRGFIEARWATRLLRASLRQLVSPYGFQWWAEDVAVYVRIKQLTAPWYVIFGARNAETGALKKYNSKIRLSASAFQCAFMDLVKYIRSRVSQRRATSIIRISDGELFFLRKRAVGSAAPGRRGSLRDFKELKMSIYHYGSFSNNLMSFSPEPSYRRHFMLYALAHPLFLNRKLLGRLKHRDWSSLERLKHFFVAIWENIFGPSIPHEAIYSLVSTRWIFREFPDQIGLIGNEHKMKLIKSLLTYPEYQRYLGTKEFTDYIAIPQKGAADNPEELIAVIGRQIRESKAKVFLVGMGHAKTAVLHRLREYTDAVIIDVGTGIDAIAGCIAQERPEFADWINYRIKDYDYTAIDQMDYEMDFWEKSKYKTITL